MMSTIRLTEDDTALLTILASHDPRDKIRLERQVPHIGHESWGLELGDISLRGYLVIFFQKQEICLAYEPAVSPTLALTTKGGVLA